MSDINSLKRELALMKKNEEKLNRMINGNSKKPDNGDLAKIVRQELRNAFDSENILSSLTALKIMGIIIIMLLIMSLILMTVYQSQFAYIDEIPSYAGQQ